MKIKCVLLFFIFLQVCTFNLTAQKTSKRNNEKEFLKTCTAIAKAYVKRDIKAMNSFIHPKTGIYLLYQPAMWYSYLHFDKLTTKYSINDDDQMIADCYPQDLEFYFPNLDSVQVIKPVKFISHIDYVCDSGWSKYGAFADAAHIPFRLSGAMKGELRQMVDYYSNEKKRIKKLKNDLIKAKNIEKKSRLVIFNQFKNKDLIFYMTLIDEKWYLTFLDFVTRCEVY